VGSIFQIILQRLALGILTLLIVSIVIFVAVNALPGDFAQAILGQGATDEAVAQIRADLGLDQNYFMRYFSWLGNELCADEFCVEYGRGSIGGRGRANRPAV